MGHINSAAEYGWISGYEDGTFRPNQYITRAEAVSMVNRVLNRYADAEFVDSNLTEMTTFVDLEVEPKHWGYYPIMEATNGHAYERNTDGSETWLALN